jgi:hypothetical protein
LNGKDIEQRALASFTTETKKSKQKIMQQTCAYKKKQNIKPTSDIFSVDYITDLTIQPA